MKSSYSQKSGVFSALMLLLWQLNLIFPEQKKFITLASILPILFVLVMIYDGDKSKLSKKLKYLFDLKFWKSNFGYLILPLFVVVSTAAFVKLTPSFTLSQLVILISLLAFYVTLFYTNRVFKSSLSKKKCSFTIFTIVKIYTAFISFSSVYGLLRDGRISLYLAALCSFAIASVLFYEAFAKIKAQELVKKILGAGLLCAVATFVAYELGLALLFSALLITVSFYVAQGLWGYDVKEKRRLGIFLDYLVLAVLVFVVIIINNPGQIL